MGIQTHSGATKTYLYLMGIKPSRPIELQDHLIVEPVVSNPSPDDMIKAIMGNETGSRCEVDLGILVATLRQTTAQMVVTAPNAKELAVRAWNAQTDITVLSALLGEEIYWHVQSDVGAGEFSSSRYTNIVVNNRIYMPKKSSVISKEACSLIEDQFGVATNLMSENRFNQAVNSLWAYRMSPNPYVQMAVLWTGIESLIGAGSYELSYRISTTAALFLETGAEGRKRIKRLYAARSKAVHEGRVNKATDVEESAALLRILILKCISRNNLPSEDELIFNHAAK